MTDGPLSIRDLLPIVAAALGYVVGGLHTALANVRERRKTLNSLLYVLLQLRYELKRSNPSFLLAALRRFIEDRFGPAVARNVEDPSVRRILTAALENAVDIQSAAATAQYVDAVRALAPFYPLLAYRLNGDQVAKYVVFVKRYYESVRQQPEFFKDPNVPAVLAVAEQRTLDLAYNKAMEQLAADALRVASASWTLKRFYTRSVLRQQDKAPDKELDAEGGAMLHQVFDQIEESLKANLTISV